MHIYRVEDREGFGPYQSWQEPALAKRLPKMESPELYDRERQPPPSVDFSHKPVPKGRITFDYKFGFKSLAQLRAWFNKHERRVMAACGFKVHEYSVKPSNVIEGGHQVAFVAAEAQSVADIALT